MSKPIELFRQGRHEELWQMCCGFLDLSLEQFMSIQRRLLLEQIELLKNCELGRKVMRGAMPETVEEFREQVPLTTYADYYPELPEYCHRDPECWYGSCQDSTPRLLSVRHGDAAGCRAYHSERSQEPGGNRADNAISEDNCHGKGGSLQGNAEKSPGIRATGEKRNRFWHPLSAQGDMCDGCRARRRKPFGRESAAFRGRVEEL